MSSRVSAATRAGPRHERLTAWVACHELALSVYRFSSPWPAVERYGLTSQSSASRVLYCSEHCRRISKARQPGVQTFPRHRPWLYCRTVVHTRSGQRLGIPKTGGLGRDRSDQGSCGAPYVGPLSISLRKIFCLTSCSEILILTFLPAYPPTRLPATSSPWQAAPAPQTETAHWETRLRWSD
jgi:hypothetical protein